MTCKNHAIRPILEVQRAGERDMRLDKTSVSPRWERHIWRTVKKLVQFSRVSTVFLRAETRAEEGEAYLIKNKRFVETGAQLLAGRKLRLALGPVKHMVLNDFRGAGGGERDSRDQE